MQPGKKKRNDVIDWTSDAQKALAISISIAVANANHLRELSFSQNMFLKLSMYFLELWIRYSTFKWCGSNLAHFLRNRIIIARLIRSESIVADDLRVVACGSFGSPWELRWRKIHIEKSEFFASHIQKNYYSFFFFSNMQKAVKIKDLKYVCTCIQRAIQSYPWATRPCIQWL